MIIISLHVEATEFNANVLLKITDNELATVHECVRAMTTSSV